MKIIEPLIEVENFDGIKIMKNIERACRTCYRSEGLITEDSYKKLLKNCINRGHESVLEHEKITVRMICDIGVYKDLTRHRFGSFSIESTRYCNYGKDKFDNEIKFIKPIFYNPTPSQHAGQEMSEETGEYIKDETQRLQETYDSLKTELWEECMRHIENVYIRMSKFAKPDELRMILPHSTAAEVTMTANIREWRHILDLRTKQMTHPAIRQLLIPLLLYFKQEMPELFDKIEYDINFPKDKYAKLVIGNEQD